MMFASVVLIFVWVLYTPYSQGSLPTLCQNCLVTHERLGLGTWYSFHFESVDWFEGLQQCMANNGSLAEIMDAKTMNYLTTHLSKEVPSNISGMWIGLRQSSPGNPSFVWQSDAHRYEESHCVTRGQGEVNCAPNMRLTAKECQNLGCCWKPLGQKCYIPNYVNTCQGAQPGSLTACSIQLFGSRHDRKRTCLEAGCCWKDWPRLLPGDAHPPCFYMSNKIFPLNFTKWISKSPDMTGSTVRKCVILSRQAGWSWEVRDCQGGQSGLGFICQDDDFNGITNESLRDTGPLSFHPSVVSNVTWSTGDSRWLNATTKSNNSGASVSVDDLAEFSTDEGTHPTSTSPIGFSVDLEDFNQMTVTTTASILLADNGFPWVFKTYQALIGSVVVVILLLIALVFVVLIWRKRRKMRSRGNNYGNHYSEPFETPTATGALFKVNPAYFHEMNTEPIAYEELDVYKYTSSVQPGPSNTPARDTTETESAADLQNPERCIPPTYEVPPSPRACVPLYLQPCRNSHTECHGYDIVPVPSP